MMHSLDALLAFANGPPIIYVMMVPVVVILVSGVIAVIGMAMKNQERQRWHETARLAISKGLPIPSLSTLESEAAPPPRHRQRTGLITAGLVNLAIGASLYLALSADRDAREARFFGLIPSFIGAALILGAVIDIKMSRKLSGPGEP